MTASARNVARTQYRVFRAGRRTYAGRTLTSSPTGGVPVDDLTLTAARAIHVARGRCSDAAQGRDCTHTSPLGRGEEDDARAVLEAVGMGEPEPTKTDEDEPRDEG